jgi:glycosyltransferase involved in cell wall biosynthesis
LKILWMSDSPTAPSGFGNVTRFVCAGLAARGHGVSILGWQTRGQPVGWMGCTVYPVRHDTFAADVLLGYLQKIQPDVLVTLADVWWLTYISNPLIANFMRTARIPWALYYPIDGDLGDGRLPASWVRILETVDLPIAMSRYGRDVTRANGVECAYIPHGVDGATFRPADDKAEARRAIGYDGRFVVLSDARNQPRKMLPRTLEIFRRFAEGRADVLLHLHCDPKDPAAATPEYWYDLNADIECLGLADKARTTSAMSMNAGLPLDRLAAIYQGFGLPTLQAAAAGVVPLACDYTASRELASGHGEVLPICDFMADQFGVRRALVDIDGAAALLEALYRDPQRLADKASAARRFAEPYDWQQVVPQWHELLEGEIPRLRQHIGRSGRVSTIRLNATPAADQQDLMRAVRAALPQGLDAALVTLNVAQGHAGELAASVMRDAGNNAAPLTIPVTLPPVDTLVRNRIAGCVFLASEDDVDVIRRLATLFPGVNAWSTTALPLGTGAFSGTPVFAKRVDREGRRYHDHFGVSTLALDLGAREPMLPVVAAQHGVPCIGMSSNPQQQRLWPSLALDDRDEVAAARLARAVLTDQGEAARVCALARERLAVLHIATV